MKEARRADRSQRPMQRGDEGTDPDIAHIKPGPQPLADWQVEVQDEETETWAPLPWWGLDPVARTVNLGYRVHGNGQYDGHLVRLRGYTTPGELAADSDETAINPEWLVARASYHALITTASRRSPADANQALGLAQVYREEADRLRGLTRTRMRPCHALGG